MMFQMLQAIREYLGASTMILFDWETMTSIWGKRPKIEDYIGGHLSRINITMDLDEFWFCWVK